LLSRPKKFGTDNAALLSFERFESAVPDAEMLSTTLMVTRSFTRRARRSSDSPEIQAIEAPGPVSAWRADTR
jgi:hypothetical protein